MEAYIYTYVNKETGKTYIGSRSAYKGKAEDDFNIKYFSSSKDKEFRQDMADGKLEGQIILKMNDEKANKKIIEIEHKMILAYWNKFGKENSYNHYANGKFNRAGATYNCSEQTKMKLSLSWDYDKHFTAETKRKMSEANSGQNNGFYGKHHSEETKQRLSESHKGQTSGMKDKSHTEEAKKKMCEAKLENPTKYWCGKQLYEETKKKLSEAHKGSRRVYDNDEHTKWHMEKI